MLFHKTVISVFLSILFLSGPVQAFQSTDRKIIIYNRFAYIIEERRIEVEKGSREYELPGLPGSSIPESIFIEYDDRDLEILKQEFNPEIFNWGEILRDNMGKEIEFMLNDGSLIKGVYYGQSGNDYLIRKDDRFTALSKEEVTSFDLQVPGMIKPFTPVFRVNINSRRKKDTQLILNYIAENIVWSGVYTGIYDENAGELEVRSWASIGNRSGSELISGNIYLIAGEPSSVSTRGGVRREMSLAVRSIKDDAMGGAEVGDAGIYHSYRIDSPLNIGNNKVQQIKLFEDKIISVDQEYVYSAHENNGRVISGLRFKNDKDAGFGEPVPTGKIRLYEKSNDSEIYLGEDLIRNTPVNRDIFIRIGTAFDLSGAKIQTGFQQYGPRSREESYRITLTNAGSELKRIIVKEYHSGQWDVLESSRDYEKISTGLLQFTVEVPAEGESVIEYKVRHN